MERETGFEPATNSLEGCDSTPELLPLIERPRTGRKWWRREDSNLRRAKPGRFTVCCHCPLGHTSNERLAPEPEVEPAPGFEPGTYGLQDRSSTPELCRRAETQKTTTPPGHSRFQEPGEFSRSGGPWQAG